MEPRRKMIEFLLSLECVQTESGRRALVERAALDECLKYQIDFSGAPAQFCPLLVSTLQRHGKSADEKQAALEALLETAKSVVGLEGQMYCDTLVQEWHQFYQKGASWCQFSTRPDDLAQNTDYVYDVFIGYQCNFIKPWVDRHFLPLFKFLLEGALGKEPAVFIPRSRESPSDAWPLYRQVALVHSKCLIAIWTPSYFKSQCCTQEYLVMFDREKQLGYRSLERPNGLVLPVIVSDGKHFPSFVPNISWFDCRNYAIPVPAFENTPMYIEFRDKMEEWVEDVAKAVSYAPIWNESWLDISAEGIPEVLVPKCELPVLR